jgi:DNA-binding IclR family transcriptional regulator
VTTLANPLTAAGRWRLARRRDNAVVRWLEQHPDSELHEIAEALHRTRLSTHRRLRRLERQGRVRSTLMDGPVFSFTVYRATGR